MRTTIGYAQISVESGHGSEPVSLPVAKLD